MDGYISVEKLIEDAKNQGVNFGKGDPYNRLRYYTKIGWLPNMKRKMDMEGNVKGHYPAWTLGRLVQIEQLKENGETNDTISRKLQVKTKFQNLLSLIQDKESRNQFYIYLSLILLLIVFANELGIIKLGKQKTASTVDTIEQVIPNQILDSGTAFMPRNQRTVFIKTPLIKSGGKIYVTFTGDYSPAVRYWSGQITEYSGFTLETDTPVFGNAEFSWWVTN